MRAIIMAGVVSAVVVGGAAVAIHLHIMSRHEKRRRSSDGADAESSEGKQVSTPREEDGPKAPTRKISTPRVRFNSASSAEPDAPSPPERRVSLLNGITIPEISTKPVESPSSSPCSSPRSPSSMDDKHGDISEVCELGEVLGSGSYGLVRQGVLMDGTVVAVKILDKRKLRGEKRLKEFTDREVSIMKELDHVGCVRLISLMDTPRHLYLMMELMTGGELFDKIIDEGYFTEEIASKLFKQVLEALEYLHEKGVVHRDLKPENILIEKPAPLSELTIKISDFGLANALGSSKVLKSQIGTPAYSAPEIHTGVAYGTTVDMWGAGVILYIMLSGDPPFWDDDMDTFMENIKEAKLDFSDEIWKWVSPTAKDLLSKLLCKEPEKRLTAEMALKHKWFTGETSKEGDNLFEHGAKERLQSHQSSKKKLVKVVRGITALRRMSTPLSNMQPFTVGKMEKIADE